MYFFFCPTTSFINLIHECSPMKYLISAIFRHHVHPMGLMPCPSREWLYDWPMHWRWGSCQHKWQMLLQYNNASLKGIICMWTVTTASVYLWCDCIFCMSSFDAGDVYHEVQHDTIYNTWLGGFQMRSTEWYIWLTL